MHPTMHPTPNSWSLRNHVKSCPSVAIQKALVLTAATGLADKTVEAAIWRVP